MSAIFHAGISGYRGRMGRAVSQVLDARDDVVVAARIDWGDEADLSLCDVVIDFSTADASLALAQAAAERGGPALVIGSTGFTPEQEAALNGDENAKTWVSTRMRNTLEQYLQLAGSGNPVPCEGPFPTTQGKHPSHSWLRREGLLICLGPIWQILPARKTLTSPLRA